MVNSDGRSKYLNNKLTILSQFGVVITEDVVNKLESLYPNEIAIENYTRKLILDKLND